MIITVGGLAGTGTTTTAEGLSEKLNIPYISAGFVFREMAAEKGMSVLEFSEFAEGNDDIDKEIDRRQAEKAKSAENLIVEGRLSAYFVENADLRVWLVTPFDVRSRRISDRENKSVENVKITPLVFEEKVILEYEAKVLGDEDYEKLAFLCESEVFYKCDCSRKRTEKILASIGNDELKSLSEEKNDIKVCCHFCGKEYSFSPDEVLKLRKNS